MLKNHKLLLFFGLLSIFALHLDVYAQDLPSTAQLDEIIGVTQEMPNKIEETTSSSEAIEKNEATTEDSASDNVKVASLNPGEQAVDSWKISIMFDITDLRVITRILRALEARKRAEQYGAEGDLDQGILEEVVHNALDAEELAKKMIAKMPKESPAFYLNSIVYKGPNDWSIWVNGTKYGPESLPERFDILNVTKKQVKIAWYTENLDLLSPGWEVRQPTETLKITEEGPTVFITLQPNQTFVARGMQIIEGRAYSSPLSEEQLKAHVRGLISRKFDQQEARQP